MKRIILAAFVIIALGAMFTSCTSSRTGCKATQNLVGYR